MKKFLLLLSVVFSVLLHGTEPLLRVGIFSDTHVKDDKSSCKLLKEALILFKKHNVKVVAHCGDIANDYSEKSYRNYRETFNSVYPDAAGRPQEIFVYANHDLNGRRKEPPFKVFEDVRKHLQIRHAPEEIIKINGVTFLTLSQETPLDRFEKMVDAACESAPGQPVFLFDHVPAGMTVSNSAVWGRGGKRAILDKYPQIIHISGHIHSTLVNELNIWQGNFTALNVGCLQYWLWYLTGNVTETRYSDMVMIMDVYKDKVIFRRFFCKSKKEYRPESPWKIRLPFDPANAPYRPEVRYAESQAPEFPAGANVELKFTNSCRLTFNSAKHPDGVFAYRIELFRVRDGKWQRYVRSDVSGDFDIENRPDMTVKHLNINYFDSGEKCRIVITPVHFFGKTGKPVVKEFTVPKLKSRATVLFESREPMKDCPYVYGLRGGKTLKSGEDGFYINDAFYTRLTFPENIWEGKPRTRFRITLEMHTIQNDSIWIIAMRNIASRYNSSSRLTTLPGDSGNLRYVIEMRKGSETTPYHLLLYQGRTGKIRFNYVKIERL